jgi:hypothetical protein
MVAWLAEILPPATAAAAAAFLANDGSVPKPTR